MDLLGFWSYVHKDDEVDMGRVAALGRDIVAHYAAIKGEGIELFLDHDDLHWGDQWRDQIDDALSNVAFFIPVITPRYFKSVECRREFQFFLNKTEKLGIRELILPILYIDVPELAEDEPGDDLMRVVMDIQWESWLPYRFKDRESGEYRAAVNELAQELVRRVESVERVDVAAAAQAAEDEMTSDDGESGVLDRLAALEEAMPRWTETMQAMSAQIEEIGAAMKRGQEDMEKGEQQGKGFAARLYVARRVAGEVGEIVDKLEPLGMSFTADLNEIDLGVRALLAHAEPQVEVEPEAVPAICEFLDGLRTLADTSDEAFDSVEGMIAASEPIERMSKDMRRPMRRLRTTLTAMLEAREVTGGWTELADGVNLDCSGVQTDATSATPS